MATQKISKNQHKAQEAWITPAYTAGWGDYDNNNWFGVRYMKDNMGFVHMKGLIKNTSGASKAANNVMFNLPAGYRPGNLIRILTSASPAPGLAACDIAPDGNVYLTSAIVSNEWASFANISFKADA